MIRADNLIVWFVPVALPSGARRRRSSTHWRTSRAGDSPGTSRREPPRPAAGPLRVHRRLGGEAVGPFSVGEYREFLGLRLKIIGRTREARSFTTNPIAFLDYRVANAGSPRPAISHHVHPREARPGADQEAVRTEIKRRLPHNDVRTKAEWAARSRNYWIENTGLGLSMYMTVFLGCLVGVVVVAQTSYTATMDHFKEFAIVKAIGGRNADIYRIIAEQATIAAVVGFLVGTALAYPFGRYGRNGLEDDHSVRADRRRLSGGPCSLPGGFVDLVPQDRRARPGRGLSRLGSSSVPYGRSGSP